MDRVTDILQYNPNDPEYVLSGLYVRGSNDLVITLNNEMTPLVLGVDYEEVDPSKVRLLKEYKEGTVLVITYSEEHAKSPGLINSGLLEYISYKVGTISRKLIEKLKSDIIKEILSRLEDLDGDGKPDEGNPVFGSSPIEYRRVPYSKRTKILFSKPCTLPPVIVCGYEYDFKRVNPNPTVTEHPSLANPVVEVLSEGKGTHVEYIGCMIYLPDSNPTRVDNCYITMVAIAKNYPNKLEV